MDDITQFLVRHGSTVLFGAVLMDQAGLPLPAAPWLLAAGALSASGRLNPLLAVLVATVAGLLADLVWFYIGRWRGARVLRWFCRLSLTQSGCVGRAKETFARRGVPALIGAKFLPGLGALMPPISGALGLSTRRFLVFDGLGTALYAVAFVLAGRLFHAQIEQVISVLEEFGFSLVLALLLAPAAYVGFRFIRRRRRVASEQPNPEPAEATLHM